MSTSRVQRPGILRITTAPGQRLMLAAALAVLGTSVLNAQTAPPRRVFPVPVLGYTPETSLLFGVALVGVASADSAGPATRPSTALLTAVYTLKRQYQLELTLDRWTTGDLWHVTGYAGVERFPSEFHGLGAQATDSSEIYTPQRLTLSAGAQRRVMRHVYVGAGYWFRHSRMAETEAGGRLAPGMIPGSRGGTDAILTLNGVWDTRDALYRTRRGGYLSLAYGIAGRALGSDDSYRRYTADARAYRGLGDVVIAAQAIMDATEGTVPFDLLPHLGGSGILRGFEVPRFTDGAMGAAQLELRAPLKSFVSVVAFGGAGATAPSLRTIPDARLNVAGGLGLRLLLDRKEGLQLRLDYAFAKGGGGFYVEAGDAF